MSDGYIHHRGSRGEYRCEFERTFEGEYCVEKGVIRHDGLRLCRRHADRLQLEDQLIYWRAMLAHVELWSGEARRRGREDMLRLLEIERGRVSAEFGRVSGELEGLEDGRHGEDGSGDKRAPPVWPPLLLLSLLLSSAVGG